MGELADRIDALVAARREHLAGVRAEVARWRRVDAAVVTLADAVAALRRHPATPPSVAARLGRLRIGDARPALAAAAGPLLRVEHRLGRDRLCVGVGGAGGSGASTLVRSLSGLTDPWLPTGDSGPVTAVRTHVLHSPERRRAVLVPHTVDTFRAAHPATGQAALWSAAGLLDRHGRPLELVGDELERLREYVTHPPARDRTAVHRHHALREARIECAFPHAEVGAVEFVDLPALVAGGRHHVAGLRYELDLALLVTRSTTATDADETALALLDEARGSGGRRDDFVLTVHNTATDHPAPPLTVDARDPADVSTRLLGPVLSHLGERLAAMDADALADARSATGTAREQMIDLAVATKVVLDQAGDATPDGDLYRRVDDLYATVAGALRGVLAESRGRAGADDPELVDGAHRVHERITAWIRDGLGVGYDRWCAAARRGTAQGGTGAFVRTELDRVRREIDLRCRSLDPLLDSRLARARIDVAAALAPLTGGVPPARLDGWAAAAARPCPVFRAAVADLLAVRLDHHTHLSHRIRPELATLGTVAADDPPPDDPAALHRIIADRAELAAARVLARLIAEAASPGWVLLTAVERFVDAVLGTGERDIRQLARTYRHDLWPGRYHGLGRDDAQVVRTVRAADELLAALADPET